MITTSELSITTAGALVLGALAALGLAIAVAVGRSHRPHTPPSPAPSTEIEYQLEPSEPAAPPSQR